MFFPLNQSKSQRHLEDELDKRHQYEDEADETDADFIDDNDPDESDSDAQQMTKEAVAALRNRRKWKETEFECPLCADLRVVLGHLLKRK
jgi:hypothetical protein